ncbi:MAG: L,D-transpeptidase [Acidimicrobiales bacterium]
MNFQNVEGLMTTGTMNTPTWQDLIRAVLKDRRDPASYNYVVVSQQEPEHLKLYQNGRVTFTSPVNTGIAAAPTADGTYPVYLRFTTTTMSGTLPDGKPYDDTGIPWVSYFHGGDALHGFIRASYGWPQSLGCVEMPFAEAAALWPHTPIGTLVTVQ